MGEKNKEIYYDLADPKWQCIKLTLEGMSIIQDSPVLFMRFNQRAQLEPDRNYPQDMLDKFLDIMHITDQGHRLLTKVWIVSVLIPDLPHPISITFGEKGGSKSTFCRFVKRLVDPDKIELLTIPKDKAEFVQQLYHNYLVVYDNIKQLPPWFSDEACKAITGVGNSKRRFYTNDEDVIYNYKRCLMINGINNSLTEPDALDRSILTEFDRIIPEQRMEESKVEKEFEEMRPKLLGCILDILTKALQIKPTIELKNLPRMADFAVWGEAIARAMGYKPIEFVNTYNENIGRQNVEALEANLLAHAIVKFVESWYNEEGKVTFWEGSTKQGLEQLNKIAHAYKIDTNSKTWPKAANYLTRRLRPILSNLREGVGINVVIGRQTTESNDDKNNNNNNNKKNTSTIRIEKVSPLSSPSPPCQNQAQTHNENGGGILTNKDSISTQQQIPPPENAQNHAQNVESGSSGYSGAIFPRLEENMHDSNNDDNGSGNIISKRYVAFDFEWSQESSSLIEAAFVDSNGNTNALHIADYSDSANPEAELLKSINQELQKQDFSIGWYSTGIARYHEDTQEYLDGVDSDLAILHNRCIANDVDSIVDFNSAGVPHLRSQTHIDLCNVFGKPIVQTTIFKNRYRTLKLDEVSKAVLPRESQSEKYKGLTGNDIQRLSIEEQKKYVLRDAELVMALSKHNSSEILDCMQAISDIIGLSLEKVCRTGISAWWQSIYDNMILNGECKAPATISKEQQENEENYVGATVLTPKKGVYHNLSVVDVSSLYPAMAILHNISFDTLNCECCKNDPTALVDKELTKDCKIEKEYRICQLNKEGAFPKKLRIFREERLRQKKLGNEVKQLALKILINGGYGVFGSRYFKYSDLRVAELITAFGRYALTKMQEIAKRMDFEAVYGDTDSLFLYKNNNTLSGSKDLGKEKENIAKFREECNKQLGVEVEHSKTYQTAIISCKKKHYVGWTGIAGEESDVKGMEGKKNGQPKWVTDTFSKVVNDIIVNNTNPLRTLQKAISDLEEWKVNPDLLQKTIRLSKNPEEYENQNDRKRKIGLEIGARKGDIIEYFESENKEGYSLNTQHISVKKYKVALWKTLKDILDIAGYDAANIEQELILNNKNMATKQSLQVAWLDNLSSKKGN